MVLHKSRADESRTAIGPDTKLREPAPRRDASIATLVAGARRVAQSHRAHPVLQATPSEELPVWT